MLQIITFTNMTTTNTKTNTCVQTSEMILSAHELCPHNILKTAESFII